MRLVIRNGGCLFSCLVIEDHGQSMATDIYLDSVAAYQLHSQQAQI